ncbi:MAG: hypothetical protein ACI9YR_002955 [Bacteroidia bacterium]|jgi:hypothetical protein
MPGSTPGVIECTITILKRDLYGFIVVYFTYTVTDNLPRDLDHGSNGLDGRYPATGDCGCQAWT